MADRLEREIAGGRNNQHYRAAMVMRVLGWIFILWGCGVSIWIWMGARAGSMLWLWVTAGLMLLGVICIVIAARYQARVGRTLEDPDADRTRAA
jgi:Flp pilus assembly protein TadB